LIDEGFHIKEIFGSFDERILADFESQYIIIIASKRLWY
jgi:hypothetical protein